MLPQLSGFALVSGTEEVLGLAVGFVSLEEVVGVDPLVGVAAVVNDHVAC